VRAVDDAYCRERLRITAEYASEMLSKRDHSRWGRDSTSRAAKEEIPWMTRSGIVQS